MSAQDLSGDWQGIYNYPDGTPPVAFEAAIRDTGGALVGSIREVDEFTGDRLEATLDGHRDGSSVRFTKFYESGDEEFDLVAYEGELGGDGLEISGKWHIPGEWSGTFIMIRAGGVAESIERTVGETVR